MLNSKTGRIALIFIVTAWLGVAWWAHGKYLPYDVKNTDVGTVLFQAQTFASGRLWRSTPEPRQFFQQWQAVVRDRSYAYYPPAHALLLALPIRLGLDPWLVPWLLGGCSLVLLFLWSERLSSPETAVLAVCVLVLSPFFAANAPSQLSHSSCLFFTVAFLWATVRWQQGGGIWFAMLSGLTLGLVFANRPVNAAALGMVWLPWLLWSRRTTLENEIRSLVSFALAALFLFGLLMLYYHAVSGRWTLELFTDYWPRNRFGFGHDLGRGEPGHYFQTSTHHDWSGLRRNLEYSFEGLARWGTGSKLLSIVLLILTLCLFGLRLRCPSTFPAPEGRGLAQGGNVRRFWFLSLQPPVLHPQSSVLLPLACWPLLHILLYAFYFTQSTEVTGPRYVFEIVPVLALAGGWTLAQLASTREGRWIFAICSLALLYWGIRCQREYYLVNALDLPLRRQVEKTVLEGVQRPALVFVRSFWLGHPFKIFMNEPGMKGPIIFACDRGEEDRILVDRNPSRNAYVLSVTPTSRDQADIRLVQVYEAATRRWMVKPEQVRGPFYTGKGFTSPVELKGEIARVLFHPLPGEVDPQ